MKDFNNMRLYIVGAAGSGKTTLANRISKKLDIECYHLDDIYYGGRMDETLSADREIRDALSEIIEKDNWIIEDNGSRKCFEKVFDLADSIILLYPDRYVRLVRIITRYIKQKLGLEDCNYKPTIKLVKRMLQGSESFEIGRDGLRDRLSKLGEKVTTLKSKHEVNKYLETLIKG